MRHLITGAGSGIGEAVVDRLHARGDELVLLARSPERAEELAARWPGAETIVADLTDPASLAAAWPTALDRLDSVIHSAGVVRIGRVAELTVEDWQWQLTVNLVAVAELTRLALPALRAAQGTVVLVNSGSGYRAGPVWSPYAASKFGLRAFADSLREEEKDSGVRVSGIHPGRVASPMQEDLHAQEGKEYDASEWIQPGTVADAILYALDLPADATVPELVLRPR
ncbi:SDR family oxidoreductase [Nocardioides rotundus]|uniref:SDR family oxidoreductase n=1 Tax=Nocardioides rotundus TaxID=1774216 RepID=UPI001CBBB96C|nr:SDR family oxidoreductase [Nocardioides rotundus]UAL28484.1 SDR family oxidoreductase [Nocardioides rotundus]